MKKFLTVALFLFASAAFASSSNGLSSSSVDSAGFSKLSEAEKAEILKQVADKAANKTVFGGTAEPADEKVEKWVRIGANIGQGLAGAAKEVGIAVNDFAKTPVGQLTMVLIVWHMIGGQLIHVFGGILIWIVGIAIIRHMVKKAYPDKVTYSKDQKTIFGNFAIEKIEKMAINDDNAAGWLFAYGVVLVAGLIAIFTF